MMEFIVGFIVDSGIFIALTLLILAVIWVADRANMVQERNKSKN